MGLVSLHGEDVPAWLQGQCTPALLVTAKGRLEAVMVAARDPEGAWMAFSQPAEPLLVRLRDFVIMEDVAGELDPRPVYWRAGEGGGAPISLLEPGRISCEAPDGLAADAMARLWRSGWLAAGTDAPAATLGPELGAFLAARAISVRKGCYLGQEVIMRIHARGRTRRSWMIFEAEAPCAADEAVFADGIEAGRLARSVPEGPRWLAGGFIRHDAAEATDWRVESGPRLIPVPLPSA
jgi:folate-binding protein YgfZ